MKVCKICPYKTECSKPYDDQTQEEISGSHFCRWSWDGGDKFGKNIILNSSESKPENSSKSYSPFEDNIEYHDRIGS